MALFSEGQLRGAVSDYVEHYHRERNHRGLENKPIEQPTGTLGSAEKVGRESRLGGLLDHYRRAA